MGRIKGENWFRFLRECAANTDTPAARFELRERTQDGSSSLMPFAIPDTWDDEFLWRRTSELTAYAQDDTNNSETGRRSYFLLALDAQGEVLNRSAQIRFHSERNALDDEGGGVELEAANPKGLLAQHMRHTEGMVRITMAATQSQIQQLSELNARMMREKMEVEEKRLDLIVEMEKLLSERHRRELDEKREASREARLDQLMGQVQNLAPALMARLLPGQAIAGDNAAKALANSVKGLVSDMPPEKMQALADLLGPEKGAGFVEILNLIERIEAGTPADGGNGAPGVH